MFETLKRLYDERRLTKEGLKNAVIKNWITPDQYKEITEEPYTA